MAETAPTLQQRAAAIITERRDDLKMAVGIVVMLLCIALIGAIDPEVVR